VAYLARDDLAGAPHQGFVRLHALQQLGGGADRRDRVAQLVRQHGQELVLAAVRFAQLFFRHLALGDVAGRADPFAHLALGVHDGHRARQGPAVAAVDAAHPVLELVH
jgi:hypothetical protein